MSTGMPEAIERAGGVRALSKALGVTHQAIYVWRRRGWAPAQRALQIEEMYGVPREQLLRPDLASLLAA